MIPLQLQAKANIISIDNWQDYHRDGEQFLKTASGAFAKKKAAFSAETIYNITAMAVEKFIMAFLMKHGDLAENHTIADLKRALARHLVTMPPELERKMAFLDSFQDICDADSITRLTPDERELAEILAIGREIQCLLTPFLQTD